jgi:hypothetical protein
MNCLYLSSICKLSFARSSQTQLTKGEACALAVPSMPKRPFTKGALTNEAVLRRLFENAYHVFVFI